MSKLNEDIIIRYLENRCSEEDFVLINEWMKESDENAGELFRMEEIYQLGKFPFEEENLVVRAERRLGRRLEQENQKKQEVFKLRSVLRYAAAIVGVMVLAAGLAYWFRNKAEELVVASAAHGQVREMLLPDGTKVWLNQSSVLKYPHAFEGKERHVYLDGEAYFEVSANKNKPFYVHTSKGEIKVLGTHFNLEAYSNADVFKTSLFEGKVRVRVKGNNIYLKPDQMVCYHKNGKIHLETIHDYDQFRWREGLICIKSAKLKDIMKTFTKYFGDSIVIQNKEVEHYKYTGKFRQSRGVINALRLLQKDAPFTIEQDEDKQIIYIK